jgi:tetratricopeptide (TPR) repeat protein
MAIRSIKPLKLFYCYTPEDKRLRNELDIHLSNLKRQYHIIAWSDREISPGMEKQKEVDAQLDTAQIILLLISPSFMASDYCYSIEMKHALERHEAGKARVIPIILRQVDWQDAPFSRLQVLPRDARAITSRRDRDDAFRRVAIDIRTAVEELLDLLKTKEEWLKEGENFGAFKQYDEALVAYEQAAYLDPGDVLILTKKGWILYRLRQYEKALAVFEQALTLDPNYISAYNGRGWTLHRLKRYREAFGVFDQTLILDPNYVSAHDGRGWTLYRLRRYEEALAAFEQALTFNPDYIPSYEGKSRVLKAKTAFQDQTKIHWPPNSK